MQQAPTSAADGTATGDLGANAKLFARHLRAGNRSPATITSYMAAVRHLDDFLAANGMPRDVANMRREHIEAFIEEQLVRLKPASAANHYRSHQQLLRMVARRAARMRAAIAAELDVAIDRFDVTLGSSLFWPRLRSRTFDPDVPRIGQMSPDRPGLSLSAG